MGLKAISQNKILAILLILLTVTKEEKKMIKKYKNEGKNSV